MVSSAVDFLILFLLVIIMKNILLHVMMLFFLKGRIYSPKEFCHGSGVYCDEHDSRLYVLSDLIHLASINVMTLIQGYIVTLCQGYIMT